MCSHYIETGQTKSNHKFSDSIDFAFFCDKCFVGSGQHMVQNYSTGKWNWSAHANGRTFIIPFFMFLELHHPCVCLCKVKKDWFLRWHHWQNDGGNELVTSHWKIDYCSFCIIVTQLFNRDDDLKN